MGHSPSEQPIAALAIGLRCQSLWRLTGRAPPYLRCNRIIELDDDDEGDAPVGAENAEQGTKGVEHLCEQDAALDSGRHIAGDILLHKAQFRRAVPAEVDCRSCKNGIQSVGEQSDSLHRKLRKKHGRNGKQKIM